MINITKFKKILICLFSYLIISTPVLAQLGIGTSTPDKSAILEMSSTEQGFLPPRLNTVERDTIETPAEGLIIYNTTEKCLQYWDGVEWKCSVKEDNSSNSSSFSSQYPYATNLRFKDIIQFPYIDNELANIMLTTNGELYGCGYSKLGFIKQEISSHSLSSDAHYSSISSPRKLKNTPSNIKKILRLNSAYLMLTEDKKIYYVGIQGSPYQSGMTSLPIDQSKGIPPSTYISNPHDPSKRKFTFTPQLLTDAEHIQAVDIFTIHSSEAEYEMQTPIILILDEAGDLHYKGEIPGVLYRQDTYVKLPKPENTSSSFKYNNAVGFGIKRGFVNAGLLLTGNDGEHYSISQKFDKDTNLPLFVDVSGEDFYQELITPTNSTVPKIRKVKGLPIGEKIKYIEFHLALTMGNNTRLPFVLTDGGDIYILNLIKSKTGNPSNEKFKPLPVPDWDTIRSSLSPDDYLLNSPEGPTVYALLRKPYPLNKPEGAKKYLDVAVFEGGGVSHSLNVIYHIDTGFYIYTAPNTMPFSSSMNLATYSHLAAYKYGRMFEDIRKTTDNEKQNRFMELQNYSHLKNSKKVITTGRLERIFFIDDNDILWVAGDPGTEAGNLYYSTCTGYNPLAIKRPLPMLNGNFDKNDGQFSDAAWNDNPEPMP